MRGDEMYTASFQVIPIKVENLEEIIDRVIEIIRNSKLRYEVNAHSTIVEGELEDLLNLQHKIIRACKKISERCVFTFQIDIKRGGVRMDDKIRKYRMES